MNCQNCGYGIPAGATRCPRCGGQVQPATPATPPVPGPVPAAPMAPTAASQKSKLVAGLLGIFLGGLGIHRFYLGYTGIGVTMLILTIVGWVLSFIIIGIPIVIGVGIWGLVEGILILVGSMNADAQGQPLKD